MLTRPRLCKWFETKLQILPRSFNWRCFSCVDELCLPVVNWCKNRFVSLGKFWLITANRINFYVHTDFYSFAYFTLISFNFNDFYNETFETFNYKDSYELFSGLFSWLSSRFLSVTLVSFFHRFKTSKISLWNSMHQLDQRTVGSWCIALSRAYVCHYVFTDLLSNLLMIWLWLEKWYFMCCVKAKLRKHWRSFNSDELLL